MRFALVFGCALLLTSCAGIRKPCQDGGDVSWPKNFGGDRRCEQKKRPDGLFVNEGRYRAYHPNGVLALEGQFAEGVKDGVWSEYDLKGKRVLQKTFEKGVEKTSETLTPPPRGAR